VTSLQIDGSVTLKGGGQVQLSGNGQGIITGISAASTLTNIDNTIEGLGQLGDGLLTIVNLGLIEATGNGQLAVDSPLTNSGTLEATKGGSLLLNDATVNNAASIITAVDAVAVPPKPSHVDLQSATIIGGTLTTTSDAGIDTIDRGSVLDGSTSAVNVTGNLHVADNTALTLRGTINNAAPSNSTPPAIPRTSTSTVMLCLKAAARFSSTVTARASSPVPAPRRR
jgi:hypothetical protein